MFLPAIEDKLKEIKKIKEEENRLQIPVPDSKEHEEYYRKKIEEKPKEHVITIQIF